MTVRKEADIAVAIRDVTQTFDTALGPVAMLFPERPYDEANRLFGLLARRFRTSWSS